MRDDDFERSLNAWESSATSEMVPGETPGETPREVPADEAAVLEQIDSFVDSPRRSRAKKFLASPIGILLVVLIVAGLVVAVVLFNQSLTPPVVAGAVLTKNCDPATPSPGTIVGGTTGFVTWNCPPSSSAFAVNAAGTVTPTISDGAPWTTTYIYKTSGTAPVTNCASAGITKQLLSGSPVVFSAADIGAWSYCSDYVSATSPMPTITYSWSQ